MSTSDRATASDWRRVVFTFGLTLGLLGATSAVFGRYAVRHFIPIQILDRAVAAGPGCVVMTGDSRIAAALSPEVVRAALARGGADACVAALGLGATQLPTEAMAVRHYLEATTSPRAVVLASLPESLVALGTEDPSTWVGNLAATFVWSQAGDERLLFDWPPRDPLAVDRLLRFETQRWLSLGSYASLLWGKVQQAQDQVASVRRGPRNQLGAALYPDGISMG
jgi:hypothetical protein